MMTLVVLCNAGMSNVLFVLVCLTNAFQVVLRNTEINAIWLPGTPKLNLSETPKIQEVKKKKQILVCKLKYMKEMLCIAFI